MADTEIRFTEREVAQILWALDESAAPADSTVASPSSGSSLEGHG